MACPTYPGSTTRDELKPSDQLQPSQSSFARYEIYSELHLVPQLVVCFNLLLLLLLLLLLGV